MITRKNTHACTHTHTQVQPEYGRWSERGKRKWRKQSRTSTIGGGKRGEEGVRARDQARDVSSHNARVLIASLDTRPILVSMGLGVLIAYSITWTFTTGWSLVSNYRSRRHGGMRPGWKLILGARSRESRILHFLQKRKINRIGWTSTGIFEVRNFGKSRFRRGLVVERCSERNSF